MRDKDKYNFWSRYNVIKRVIIFNNKEIVIGLV